MRFSINIHISIFIAPWSLIHNKKKKSQNSSRITFSQQNLIKNTKHSLVEVFPFIQRCLSTDTATSRAADDWLMINEDSIGDKESGAKNDSLYLKLVDQYLVDELGLGSWFVGDSPAKGWRAVRLVLDIRVVGLGAITTPHHSTTTTAPSQCSTRYHLYRS